MARNRTYLSSLLEYAFMYIDECESKRKEQLSNKGDIVKIEDRKNPTIDYFLSVWLPKNCKKNKTISRSTYYRWVKWNNTDKQKIITQIDDLISAVQKDVMANEGKGVQYLKYKFGWVDKSENKTEMNVKTFNAEFNQAIQSPPQSSDNTQLDK
jgi:hypothetical protein